MTASVQVLNASYEPLAHTRLNRAVSLLLAGEAVAEESIPGRWLRHATGALPWPRVIRLLRYVKVPFKFGPAVWSKNGVLKRDSHRCGYCGRTANTVDHIVPRSRGGADRDWLNTVAACVKCNGKKAARTPEEWGKELQTLPSVPQRVMFY